MIKDWINKFTDALDHDQTFAEQNYRRDAFWRMMVNQLARNGLRTKYYCDNIPEAVEFFEFIEGNGFKTKVVYTNMMGFLTVYVRPLERK